MPSLASLLLWGPLAVQAFSVPKGPLARRDAAAEPLPVPVDTPPVDPKNPWNPFQLPRPSQDPFYKPSPGWESKAPGTVLGIRHNAYKGPQNTPNYYTTMQVLFRTTDSHQRPSYGASIIYMPNRHKRCAENFRNSTLTPQQLNCSHAILSYHLPYDTSCFDASLSFGLQRGEPYGEIEIALRKGWVVAVPDYEGPRASYGANILAGYTILDSFRALRAMLGNYGVRIGDETRMAMWGYSSGGTATEFAAELAAAYAPELKLHGAVVGGMTGNMSASLDLVNGHDVAGLFIQGLIGLTMEYPEQRTFLNSRLKKEGQFNITEFYLASYMSGMDSLRYFSYHNVYEYFFNGKSDVYHPTMMIPFELEGIGGIVGTPNMPVLFYQSINDEMCPIEYLDPVVKRHCDNGANIWHQRNALGNHNLEGTNGRQRSLNFLTDVLDGTNISGRPLKGCKIEDVIVDQNLLIPFY